MTKSIDEWAADKCDVVLGYVPNYNGHGTKTWEYKRVQYYWAWTIKDPRCREIFRNWWLNDETGREVAFDKHKVTYLDLGVQDDIGPIRATHIYENGGEESCITTIYEEEK